MKAALNSALPRAGSKCHQICFRKFVTTLLRRRALALYRRAKVHALHTAAQDHGSRKSLAHAKNKATILRTYSNGLARRPGASYAVRQS